MKLIISKRQRKRKVWCDGLAKYEEILNAIFSIFWGRGERGGARHFLFSTSITLRSKSLSRKAVRVKTSGPARRCTRNRFETDPDRTETTGQSSARMRQPSFFLVLFCFYVIPPETSETVCSVIMDVFAKEKWSPTWTWRSTEKVGIIFRSFQMY